MKYIHAILILAIPHSIVSVIWGANDTGQLGDGTVTNDNSPMAVAETYHWIPWTFPTSQSASAFIPGLGSVDVSVAGASTSTRPFTLQFNNVTFSPTVAGSAGVGSTTLQVWSFQIDLMSLSQTSGIFIGFGNFGHGTASYP